MKNDVFKNCVRLRHLDCFVCVAETGHLGKAAARLQPTQPAVSKTLNELEEIVGRQLLERGRSGASLTREGWRFLDHATAVMDALAAGRAEQIIDLSIPCRLLTFVLRALSCMPAHGRNGAAGHSPAEHIRSTVFKRRQQVDSQQADLATCCPLAAPLVRTP